MPKKTAQRAAAEASAPAPDRRLVHMPLSALTGALRNPKLHSVDIPKSIGRFGFTEPLLLDERTERLVAGHGRRDALAKMKAANETPPAGVTVDASGEWLVPVIRGWASRSDREAEAYLVASNRLTEAGGWDTKGLTDILKELAENDALDGVGYSPADLTKLLSSLAPAVGLTDPDAVPEAPKEPYVQPGQLYELGEHRIICGSSTEGPVVDRLMAGELAELVFTDPPWNVGYDDGKPATLGHGRAKPLGPIANDNLGEDFPQFCAAFTAEMNNVMKPGALLYLVMSAQEWGVICNVLKAFEFYWSSTIIWVKQSAPLSRKDYHPQYEPIWYGWKEGARLHPVDDRKQTDVWEISRQVGGSAVGDKLLHPTTKPVELVERALNNSSRHGAVVYEPFSGSGTTLLACERTGRKARCIELMPAYVQVAIQRWEEFTGKKAKLVT